MPNLRDIIDRLRSVWGYHAGLAMDGDSAHQRMADALEDLIAIVPSKEVVAAIRYALAEVNIVDDRWVAAREWLARMEAQR